MIHGSGLARHYSAHLPTWGVNSPRRADERSVGRERTLLFSLASRALFDAEGRLGDGFLLIRRVSTDFPEEILFDEQQDRFTATRERIATQLL